VWLCVLWLRAANSGLVVPLLPFGMPKFDAGERFDLRSPYADDGWVVSVGGGICLGARVGGMGGLREGEVGSGGEVGRWGGWG
jgi:hypothetical protein